MRKKLAITVVFVASCSPPGGPKYPSTAPTALPDATSTVRAAVFVPDRTGLEIGTWAGAEGHNNFRIDFASKDLPPFANHFAPPTARLIGDVRSMDDRMDDSTYAALECGWGFLEHTSAGSIREPCASRDRAADAKAMLPRIASKLKELKDLAERAGANAVVQVKCWGMTKPLRLFCEGVAAVVDDKIK